MASANRSNGSIEDNLRGVYERASSSVTEQLHQVEDSVRKSPTNSVLMAAVAGYFLNILPIGALLSGILRLITALIRPAIVLYVAAKGYELLRSASAASPASSTSSDQREIVTP